MHCDVYFFSSKENWEIDHITAAPAGGSVRIFFTINKIQKEKYQQI
jgi:hypothetical protein